MRTQLPVLTENKFIRFLTVTGLYVAQGIQMGLMMVAIPAYLAGQGVDPGRIGGFIGAIMLPWSLKLFSAPIMDRFSFLPMGRRRPWVMFGLIGAALGFVAMALVPDPVNRLFELTLAAVVASSFTAVMDVAVDGMAIDVLPVKEQSRANGFMWGGKVLGAAATTAGAAFTLDAFGMPVSFMVAAIFYLLFGIIPFLFRERSGERFLPWTDGKSSPESRSMQLEGWADIVKSLGRVFILPSSLILALAGFMHGMTYGLFDAIMPVITVQELGWDDTAFSSLAATAGLIGGIVGMTVGGKFIEYFGRLKSMKLFLICLGVLAAIMGLAVSLWEHNYSINLFVILVYACRTLILISLFATAMAFCWKPVAATQFALYMAIGNLGISAGAPLLGPLSNLFSYAEILLCLAGFAVLTTAVLLFIKMDKHILHLENLPPVSEIKIEIST